ncbi:MAG: hypothetical protein GSR86_02255 [Desulfurococcales archaeon]|nr:hypothetical protein [Desulfurococcales archaeon]
MMILVIGLYPTASGKTLLASSLVSLLKREGFNVLPFKPVGGTDVWENPLVLKESRRHKVLVTGDALALRRPLGNIPIELVNPQGFIIVPLDPERFSWKVKDTLSLHGLASRIPLARVSFCRGDRIYSTHFYNASAAGRTTSTIEQEVLKTAAELFPRPLSASTETVENILEGLYVAEADECLRHISSMADIVVVESNSNVAAPTPATAAPEMVVAVSPGAAYIIRGDRFQKAVSIAALAGKPWSVESEEAVSLAGVEERILLPLLEDPMEGYTVNDLQPIIEYIKSLERR